MSSQKSFPVTWDQFHRDSRALAWRLTEAGPFEACVAITRGGLVPAAIVARELEIALALLGLEQAALGVAHGPHDRGPPCAVVVDADAEVDLARPRVGSAAVMTA